MVLVSGVLGPVLMSHWVHSGLYEDCGHVLPVDDVEGHGHPLPRSEVTMDAYLSLSLPPQFCSGNFDEGDDDTGLPVGSSSHGVRPVVVGLVYDTGDVGNGDQALAYILASRGA